MSKAENLGYFVLQIVFSLTFFSILQAQSGASFFEQVGEIPDLGLNATGKWQSTDKGPVYVEETYNESFDGLVINSKGILIGYRKEDSGTIGSSYSPGVIYRSTDHGKSWENISNRLPGEFNPPKNDFEKLANYYTQTIYSVGSMDSMFFMIQGLEGMSSRFLRSDDNGSSWKVVSRDVVHSGSAVHSNKTCSNPKDDILIASRFNYNSTFSGGWHLQNISKDNGQTWEAVNATRANTISKYYEDDANLYWRKQSETKWMKKEEWLQQNPNAKNSGIVMYSAAIYNFFEDQFRNTLYRLIEPEAFQMATIISQNPKKPARELIQSKDNGKTWEKVGFADKISRIDFVDCNGNIYAGRHDPQLGFYQSANEGKTWQQIIVAPHGYLTQIAPDGHLYLIVGRKIYKSKSAACCNPTLEEPESDLDYGTTVITHGLLPHPPIAETYDSWVEELANGILSFAEKGRVFVYNPETRKLDLHQSKGNNPEEGEQIILFDWHPGSIWKDTDIYAYLAAEELFLSLVHSQENINLTKIHFIGQGTGCYVNTYAAERLIQFKDEIQRLQDFSFDQVTMIEPIGYISPVRAQIRVWKENNFVDIYTRGEPIITSKFLVDLALIEALKIGTRKIDRVLQKAYKNPQINITESTIREIDGWLKKSDPGALEEDQFYTVYAEIINILQAIPLGQDLAELTFALDALRIIYMVHFVYENWNEKRFLGITPSQIFTWENQPIQEITDNYTNSIGIKNESYALKGGYYLSRLMGGKGRKILSWQGKGSSPVEFNLEEFGIFNGAFSYISPSMDKIKDKNFPGWQVFGGRFDEEKKYCELESGGYLLHQEFYLPEAVNKLSFQIKSENITEGKLYINFLNSENKIVQRTPISLGPDIVSFIDKEISIETLKKSLLKVRFSFSGSPYDTSEGTAKILLDNIKLVR